MMLTTHLETGENKVVTVPLSSEAGKEKIYLKDQQWELMNEEDVHNLEIDAEEDPSKRSLLAVTLT